MLLLQPTTELLLQHDELIPRPVQSTIRFLEERGVSARFSRNPVAYGCEDAATKRLRNGRRGIPLTNELKSLAGAYITCGSSEHVFLCHIPAHRRFDIRKIRTALSAPQRPRWLSAEGCQRLGIGFGRVNPFFAGIQHIFDRSLLNREGSMMTNAGDRTWAVEFCPADLIRSIHGSIIADVLVCDAIDQDDRQVRLSKVDLIASREAQARERAIVQI